MQPEQSRASQNVDATSKFKAVHWAPQDSHSLSPKLGPWNSVHVIDRLPEVESSGTEETVVKHI